MLYPLHHVPVSVSITCQNVQPATSALQGKALKVPRGKGRPLTHATSPDQHSSTGLVP